MQVVGRIRPRRRPGSIVNAELRVLELAVLKAGMTVIVFLVERRLRKTLVKRSSA